MNIPCVDLKARAHQAMLDEGFHPDFPPAVLSEAAKPAASEDWAALGFKDLRQLLWSSIDNDTSRDLDQIEYAERLEDGTIRLMIGIADVDLEIPMNSETDKLAGSETTSVYTGVATYPMLPDVFSTNRTSLLGQQERNALIIEMHVSAEGEVDCKDVCLGRVLNYAKLAYSSTGGWLEGTNPIPQAIASVKGMEAQIRLQYELSLRMQEFRKKSGSLSFDTIEPSAVMENGDVKGLTVVRKTVASDIIESFMVAANVSIAKILREAKIPAIRRVVKTPRRWDRIQELATEYGDKLPDSPSAKALESFLTQRKQVDPAHFADLSLAVVKMMGSGEYLVTAIGHEDEGHFGLSVNDYTHSTAPNRRYPDLVTQRLVKALMRKQAAPYSLETLTLIAARCTERESASRKVQRFMRKVIAACFLRNQIGPLFDAIITGVNPKGTFVRLLKFPAEGILMRGQKGVDVGDRLQVKLVSVDVNRGFIDFERR